MDAPAPRPDSAPGLTRPVAVLLWAGALLVAGWVAWHGASFASGSDSSGYFNSARLLAEGRFFATPRTPLGYGHTDFGWMTFQPLGFIADKSIPRMAPTYPTGLPLHLLAASWLVGWNHAAGLVNGLMLLLSGVSVWGLARRLGLPPAWAAAGVAWLWFCPLTGFAAMQPMSDLLALAWSMAALWAAVASAERRGWALAAGAALALAVLGRPTDLLLVLPVAVCFGLDWRRYLLLGLGGLPGAAFFAAYNRAVYGSPFSSGYGEVWATFSRDYLAHNLAHFAHWIPLLLSPLVLLALAAPGVRAARRREAVALGLWAVVIVGFYAFYYHSGETWWYLRFILPAYPVLILAALLVLHAAASRLPGRAGPVVAGLLLAAVLGWEVRQLRTLEVASIPNGERHYLQSADWALAHLPPQSAVYCMQVSGSFHFYTPFLLVRWDQVKPERAQELFAALRAEHRPVYAALFDFETADFQARFGGHWKRLERVGETTFWQLETATP